MGRSYIPTKDVDFNNWATTFAAAITANVAAYGLIAADAAAINLAQSNWAAAYALVVDPATRTAPTIAAKDTERTSATITFRAYANIIQANAGVSNENKLAAGLTIRDTSRTPVPTPTTVPIVGSVGQLGSDITLRYSDSATPTTKAKPPGSIGMLVFAKIGTAPSADPTGATLLQMVGKSPFVVSTNPTDVGKVITIWGQWITRTGKIGAFGAPISTTITAP